MYTFKWYFTQLDSMYRQATCDDMNRTCTPLAVNTSASGAVAFSATSRCLPGTCRHVASVRDYSPASTVPKGQWSFHEISINTCTSVVTRSGLLDRCAISKVRFHKMSRVLLILNDIPWQLCRFKTHACRRAHEKGHDPAEASECGICGKQFKTRTLARIHVKSQHINNDEQAKCDICGAEFRRKESVRRHMEVVHQNVR